MKKSLLILTIASVLITSTRTPVYAGAIIGSTFPQQIVDQIVQIYNGAAEYATKLNTMLVSNKATVLDPIANALIAQAQQQAANDIINWAKGGFHGTPSFIADPEKFIKNRGLSAVKNATISINLQDPYANSILNGVVKSYRSNDSVEQQLADLSVSQIPVLLQDNVCKDATLVKLATDQTRNRDGTTNYSAMIAQKTELYRTLCAGDPKRDPVLARKLKAIADSNQSLTGLDGILAVSSGDNKYVKRMKAISAADQAAEKARQQAAADQAAGGGLASQRTCKVPATNEETGESYCKEWQISAPSGLVRDATAKAQGAGIDRLSNIQGDGALNKFLTGFATIAITQAIKSAVESSNEPDVMLATTQTTTNTSVTTSGAQPIILDLVGDAERKQALIAPIEKQFTLYTKTLNDLDAVDTVFLTEIDTYNTTVMEADRCYDALIVDRVLTIMDSRYTQASSTIINRKNRVLQKRAELGAELSSVQRALTLIADTRTKMASSSSSQEIAQFYSVYESQTANGTLPDTETYAKRQGDYNQTKTDVKDDVAAGDLRKVIDQCNQIRMTRNNNS